MQKYNKKASILLWSVFLSLFIGVIFIGISTKINKSLEENYTISDNIKRNLHIHNIINDNYSSEIIDMGNGEMLFIEGKKRFTTGLKQEKGIEITTPQKANVTIEVEKGLISYEEGYRRIFLNDIATITSNTGDTVKIQNQAGYSKITVSSEKEMEIPYRKYKVFKKIGNKIIEKKSGKITN